MSIGILTEYWLGCWSRVDHDVDGVNCRSMKCINGHYKLPSSIDSRFTTKCLIGPLQLSHYMTPSFHNINECQKWKNHVSDISKWPSLRSSSLKNENLKEWEDLYGKVVREQGFAPHKSSRLSENSLSSRGLKHGYVQIGIVTALFSLIASFKL